MEYFHLILMAGVSIGILATVAISSASDDTKIEWKLDRIECWGSRWCIPYHCELVRKSRQLQVINGNCSLTEPIVAIHLHLKLFYRFQRYKPFLLDVHADLCDAFSNRTKFQPIMDLARPFIVKYTNVNHPCPWNGTIWVRDLYYNNGLLKGTLMPSGQYRVDMRLYDPRTNETMFAEQSYITHSSSFTTRDLSMGR